MALLYGSVGAPTPSGGALVGKNVVARGVQTSSLARRPSDLRTPPAAGSVATGSDTLPPQYVPVAPLRTSIPPQGKAWRVMHFSRVLGKSAESRSPRMIAENQVPPESSPQRATRTLSEPSGYGVTAIGAESLGGILPTDMTIHLPSRRFQFDHNGMVLRRVDRVNKRMNYGVLADGALPSKGTAQPTLAFAATVEQESAHTNATQSPIMMSPSWHCHSGTHKLK